MSVSLSLTCFISPSKSHLRTNLSRLNSPLPPRPKNHNPPIIRCIHEKSDHLPVIQTKPRWEDILSTAASLYPVYVTVGGAVAVIKPSAYAWFVQRGPASYSLSLGLIMLAMGLTLKIRDLVGLFMQRPLSIIFGCAAQYTIMPAFGVLISKLLALPPSLSVGLILLSYCPGGTASNVVTFIAQGDVPLSIVMTMYSTLGAVLFTPLLTKILAGTFVPVDAVKLSLSTLQGRIYRAHFLLQ